MLGTPVPPGLAGPGPGDGDGDGLRRALLDVLPAAIAAISEAGQTGPAGLAVTGRPGACTHEHAAAGYRIPARLRALVEARDQYCGFPVCRRPAAECDLDHTIPYHRGGRTCSCDLSAECRHHHRMKTLTRWRLGQPRPGELVWVTPAGLAYTRWPEPHPA